jgi:hypothetical protein
VTPPVPEETPDAEYGLVMPFVVVQSKGGPYEDRAFTAGWLCGHTEASLRLAPLECPSFTLPAGVNPDVVPQLDLLAMDNGWTLITRPYEDGEEFVFVTFIRSGEEAP